MLKWFDERFHIVEGVRDHLQEDELGIAKREVEEVPKPKEEAKAKAEVKVAAEQLKTFTLDELQTFDGTEGKPIYVAYKRKVYDLSKSLLFQGEKRMRCHIAGKDLTKDIDVAPHGEDLIFKFPLVGKIEG
jgi:predicted heme/steroid binding protein